MGEIRKRAQPIPQGLLWVASYALGVLDEGRPDEVVDPIVVAYEQHRPVEILEESTEVIISRRVVPGAAGEIGGVPGHISKQDVRERFTVVVP